MLVRELTHNEYRTVARALRVLESLLHRPGAVFHSPTHVADYLRLRLATKDREVFAVLLLDAQHGLIDAVELFAGTLSQTAVYPREIARLALLRNAAAVVLAHNHPSEMAEPSAADDYLTQAVKTALATLDIAVLDHMVVTGARIYSFAQHGRI